MLDNTVCCLSLQLEASEQQGKPHCYRADIVVGTPAEAQGQ
jgi:hypothetical protein